MTKEAKAAESGKKFRVTIHSGEDKGDKGDVFLAHNFHSVLIQRDKEVVLDEKFVNVLNDSVIHTITKDEDGTERPIRIPRYAFTVSPA
jgi:hypothetical protein